MTPNEAQNKAIHAGAKTKVLKGKTKFYVGHSNEPYKREVFGSKETPTKESHPQYGHVRSGFKSKKDAESKRQMY